MYKEQHLNAVHAKNGALMADLMNHTERGYRADLSRRGIKPKNHHKNNIRNIKKTQLMIRESKRKAKEDEDKLKNKANKFSHVAAKVFEEDQKTPSSSVVDTLEKHEFL
eukprot:37879_1